MTQLLFWLNFKDSVVYSGGFAAHVLLLKLDLVLYTLMKDGSELQQNKSNC